MKVNLNITSAMTLRKRMNALMNTLECNLMGCVVVDPALVDTENTRFITGSFDTDLDLYERTLYAIGCLSQDIEANNLKGKVLLQAISLANKRIRLYERIANNLSINHTVKVRNPVSGEWEVTQYVDLTKVNAKALKSTATTDKNTAEDMLSEFNGKTTFDFEVDDDVYHRAYEV